MQLNYKTRGKDVLAMSLRALGTLAGREYLVEGESICKVLTNKYPDDERFVDLLESIRQFL